MSDPSTLRSARAERIKGSPYSRPTPSKLNRSMSSSPFSTLRSVLSYVASPFTSRTRTTLPTTIDDINDTPQAYQKSESGSEDNWNGEPPLITDGQDVFSFAAAAGREGQAFEERAAQWRARGELPGGRRETARQSLQGPSANSPTMPRHLQTSPSIPVLPSRPAPPVALPPRAPIPSFQPPSQPAATSINAFANLATSGLTTRPGSAALVAFLEAKKGQGFTPEDFEVIDTLTKSMKNGSQAGSPPRDPVGGWAAGTFISTPRRPDSGVPLDPIRARAGEVFSVGLGTPLRPTLSEARLPVRYLGPGMSPRRLLPKAKPGLKPLISFDFQKKVEEDIAAKKRKLQGGEAQEVPSTITPSVPLPNLAESSSMAVARASTSRNTITPAADSPHPSAVAVGKKRAADIMLELIEQDRESEKVVDAIIFNPYDRSQAHRSPPQAVSPDRPPNPKAVPGRPILRASTSTPLRGAAARLEASKSKGLSVLDLFKGSSRATEYGEKSPGKSARIDLPESSWNPHDNEDIDIETFSRDLEANLERAKEEAKKSRDKLHKVKSNTSPMHNRVVDHSARQTAAAINPLSTPELQSHHIPIPPPKNLSPHRRSPPTKGHLAFSYTPSKSENEPEPPRFSTTFKLPSPPQENFASRPTTTFTPSPKLDLAAFYLSPKDTALKIAEEVLPFYTFTLPFTSATRDPAIIKAKAEALNHDAPEYVFTMPTSSAKPSTANQIGFPGWNTPKTAEGDWKCSLCDLTNPSTATEKCTVCETPRPKTEASSGPAATPFTLPIAQTPGAEGEWKCSTCDLKNPASATEKCTICEAPRPKIARSSAQPGFTFNPGPAATPFTLPLPASKVEGEWKCSTCDLKNPSSATEKCTICEAPRPKSAGSGSSTTANPSNIPAPTFSFPSALTKKKADGEWECSTCMLTNPVSATEKCTVCEAPKPK